MHKTPRMGPQCGESLLLGRGDGETCLVVGITGVPETDESGRGAHTDLVGDGMDECMSLQIFTLPTEFMNCFSFIVRSCFLSVCKTSVMRMRFLVGMT